MKTTELMQENYISFINRTGEIHIPQKHPLKVISIGLFKVEVCQINENIAEVQEHTFIDSRDICGIPLTEYWLIRFGFNEIGERLYCRIWRKDRVDIYKMIGADYPFYFSFNQVDSKLKFVHQLQNLYFSLTNKKLS